MTCPELLAIASGKTCEGNHWCVFCGAAASEPYKVLDTFTARDTLTRPGSGHICNGCLIATEESGTATYHDGTTKEWTKAFRRCHSWVITRDKATPYFAGHMDELRRVIMDPPAPPYSICVVGPTNGKQMLYLTPVTFSDRQCKVLLEGEPVQYTRQSLEDRLIVTTTIAMLAGKPSLSGPPGVAVASVMVSRNLDDMLSIWCHVHSDPLSRLAVFLTPKKDDCDGFLNSINPAAARRCHAG